MPLDLSYPVERLQFILEDSAPVALLVSSDGHNLENFGNAIHEGIQVLDIANEDVFSSLPETNLERAETGVDAENLACVIYTSGSTGEPKGSEIPHRSIPGFIFGTDYVRWDEETVLLQHSSVSWDAFTLELWPALLRGGRSVLAQRERVLSAEEIRKYVQGPWSEYAVADGGHVQLDGGKRCGVSARGEVFADRWRGGIGDAHSAGDGETARDAGGERVWAIGMHGVQQLLCGAAQIAGDS